MILVFGVWAFVRQFGRCLAGECRPSASTGGALIRRSPSGRLVGRESVIAGTDCGFGTWVGQAAVVPDIAWAKLASMAEGARRATPEFW
jgi:hypothetical protein